LLKAVVTLMALLSLLFRLEDLFLQQPFLGEKPKIDPSIGDDRIGWRLRCIRDGGRRRAAMVFIA
jgi:hypothetical protein